jgi:hypothetical protein
MGSLEVGDVGERSRVLPGGVVMWYDGDGGGGGKSEWYNGAGLAGAMVLPMCRSTNSVISVQGWSISGGGEGILIDLTLYCGSEWPNCYSASWRERFHMSAPCRMDIACSTAHRKWVATVWSGNG